MDNLPRKEKKFNRTQWLILGAFLLAVLFVGYQAFRSVEQTLRLRREQRDQREDELHKTKIRGWMTVGYAARLNSVPPHRLQEALGLPERRDRRSLNQIARAQGRPVEELIAVLEETIAREQPPAASPEARGDGGRERE